MNDHRITSLGLPRDGTDAVTKRWVNQQLKDGIKDIDELQDEIAGMKRTYDTTINGLEKKTRRLEQEKVDKADCLPSAGGAMRGDIDMQKHHIHNLPLPKEDGEPVTHR